LDVELQWLLLAQAVRLHPSGLLDIVGIFHRVTVSGERLTPAFTIVAKVKFDPLLASEETAFTFRVVNLGGDWLEEIELPFTYPTLEQWTRGVWPIIRCVLSDFEFPDVGEYAVEVYHNGNLIGSETFILARQEEAT
jgi:hypothetical protein